jgi:tetratricopeptide (TPR) repeat protein
MIRTWLVTVVVLAGLSSVTCTRQDRSSPASTSAAANPNDGVRTLDNVKRMADEERPQGSLPVRDAAMEMLRRGEALQAEELLQQHLKTTADTFGTDSREYAWSQFDLATIYLGAGMNEKSILALRAACAVKPDGSRPAAKDRLTFLMNLGQFLEYDGQLDEAEQILRECLVERAAFYGRDHPGFAYGLEPLAGVLLRQNKLDEALTLADEAVANLLRNEHAHIVNAMALRAEILATRGDNTAIFAGHEVLSNDLVADLVTVSLPRASAAEPETGRHLLAHLFPIVRTSTINVLLHQSNLEKLLGNSARQAELLSHVVAASEAMGDTSVTVNVLKALAMAHNDMGNTEASERTYRDAAAKAQAANLVELQSNVARNFGLFLAEHKRLVDAREQMESALTLAQSTSDATLIGAAQVALGILYQHQGDKQRAALLLQEACEQLDPLSTDALCGRSHLTAIQTGAECGCSEATMQQALTEAIRLYVLQRLPAGLLKNIHVRFDAAHQWKIELEPARPPTVDEQQQVNRVLDHAQAHFVRQVQGGVFAPAYQRLRN